MFGVVIIVIKMLLIQDSFNESQDYFLRESSIGLLCQYMWKEIKAPRAHTHTHAQGDGAQKSIENIEPHLLYCLVVLATS